LTLIIIESCTKDFTSIQHAASYDHQALIHEAQRIPAGIYTGESTHLKNGIAYSWMEFSGVDKLESVNISLPLAELLDPAAFLYGSYANTIEINMPVANRCKEIFNTIIVTRSLIDAKAGIQVPARLSFNFYLNSAPFNSSMDCHAHHAFNKMPYGFNPVLSRGGCINGLGLIWNSEIEVDETNYTEMLLGSANGDLAFYSPTISLAAIANRPDFVGDVPLPIVMTPGRYYPTKFHIKQSGTELVVSLEKFVHRN